MYIPADNIDYALSLRWLKMTSNLILVSKCASVEFSVNIRQWCFMHWQI